MVKRLKKASGGCVLRSGLLFRMIALPLSENVVHECSCLTREQIESGLICGIE